jgi:hypothetical protein
MWDQLLVWSGLLIKGTSLLFLFAVLLSLLLRNLFLTGGLDGTVKLFHILEQTPIHKWQPAVAHQQQGNLSAEFLALLSFYFDIRVISVLFYNFCPMEPSSPNGFCCCL